MTRRLRVCGVAMRSTCRGQNAANNECCRQLQVSTMREPAQTWYGPLMPLYLNVCLTQSSTFVNGAAAACEQCQALPST